jgi:hypothetical protein
MYISDVFIFMGFVLTLPLIAWVFVAWLVGITDGVGLRNFLWGIPITFLMATIVPCYLYIHRSDLQLQREIIENVISYNHRLTYFNTVTKTIESKGVNGSFAKTFYTVPDDKPQYAILYGNFTGYKLVELHMRVPAEIKKFLPAPKSGS